MLPPLDLVLASTSPRRHALLARAGFRFVVCEPGDEYERGDEHESAPGVPRELAAERAARKAQGARSDRRDVPVLGVDTVVDLDGVELGKARDRAACERMLLALAGREHLVHTAHCLLLPDGRELAHTTSAVVRCRQATAPERARYLDSEQWRGKAGGYGIQDPAQDCFELVLGELETVIGLSTVALRGLLQVARDGR